MFLKMCDCLQNWQTKARPFLLHGLLWLSRQTFGTIPSPSQFREINTLSQRFIRKACGRRGPEGRVPRKFHEAHFEGGYDIAELTTSRTRRRNGPPRTRHSKRSGGKTN